MLIQEKLLVLQEDGVLSRTYGESQLSFPVGLKVHEAQAYIDKSLALASRNYELPLEDREFCAFTARIDKNDFPKLKDAVREFRKYIYGLSKNSEYDSVIHVNVNAAVIHQVNLGE